MKLKLSKAISALLEDLLVVLLTRTLDGRTMLHNSRKRSYCLLVILLSLPLLCPILDHFPLNSEQTFGKIHGFQTSNPLRFLLLKVLIHSLFYQMLLSKLAGSLKDFLPIVFRLKMLLLLSHAADIH
jgi:hypothetical protein